MSYDTEAIRERISISSLFERDGHQLRRVGARRFAVCPFHEERSGSCHVDDKRGTFYCFGCESKGDIFEYWMRTRGVDFPSAGAALAELAGTGVIVGDRYERPARTLGAQKPEIPAPLGGRDLERWEEGLRFLASSEDARREVAEWRGYEEGTVLTMGRAGLIGMPLHFGERRVAFPVHAVGEDGAPFLAGFHVRVASREKPESAIFHYVPSGIGGWPYVIGDLRRARAVLIVEGQWDALAIADGAGFGPREKGVAIVGIRGAHGWRKLLPWQWPRDAQIIAFSDSDEAGMNWWEPDEQGECFGAHLRLRSRALHAHTWDGVKDFNDAHRAAIALPGGREGWRTALRELLRRCWSEGLRKRRRRPLAAEPLPMPK